MNGGGGFFILAAFVSLIGRHFQHRDKVLRSYKTSKTDLPEVDNVAVASTGVVRILQHIAIAAEEHSGAVLGYRNKFEIFNSPDLLERNKDLA